jgi:hypothetical protein
MKLEVPTIKAVNERGKVRELPLYDSARPLEREAVVYMVKTLPDGCTPCVQPRLRARGLGPGDPGRVGSRAGPQPRHLRRV